MAQMKQPKIFHFALKIASDVVILKLHVILAV